MRTSLDKSFVERLHDYSLNSFDIFSADNNRPSSLSFFPSSAQTERRTFYIFTSPLRILPREERFAYKSTEDFLFSIDCQVHNQMLRTHFFSYAEGSVSNERL
jgi:hypothetical protein